MQSAKKRVRHLHASAPRGLASAGRAGDDQVGHVAFARNDLQTRDRVLVAHNVFEQNGSVLFDPRQFGQRIAWV
jgi:hypothetical protein